MVGEAPPLKLAQAPHTSPTQGSAGLCGLTGGAAAAPASFPRQEESGVQLFQEVGQGRRSAKGRRTSPPGASAAPHLPASLHVCRSLSASPGLLPSPPSSSGQNRADTRQLVYQNHLSPRAKPGTVGEGVGGGGPAQPPGVSGSPCHTSVLQDPTTSPGTVRTSHCRVKGCLDPHSQGVGAGWHPGLHAVPLGGRNCFLRGPPVHDRLACAIL